MDCHFKMANFYKEKRVHDHYIRPKLLLCGLISTYHLMTLSLQCTLSRLLQCTIGAALTFTTLLALLQSRSETETWFIFAFCPIKQKMIS
jgi:hypothetical protein